MILSGAPNASSVLISSASFVSTRDCFRRMTRTSFRWICTEHYPMDAPQLKKLIGKIIISSSSLTVLLSALKAGASTKGALKNLLFDGKPVQVWLKWTQKLHMPVLLKLSAWKKEDIALTIDELMSAGNASKKNKDLLIDSFISQSHHVEEPALERWPLMEMNQTILN